MHKAYETIGRWTGKAVFPLAAIGIIVGWSAFLLGLAAVGPYLPLLIQDPELLQFLDEVREFCLGYNRFTGAYRKDYLLMMVIQPVVLLGIVLAVWGREVREALARLGRGMRRRPGVVLAAATILLAGFAGVVVYASALPAREDPAFEPIRKFQAAPDFRLLDQDGAPLRLGDLKGKVVALTFIYTNCRGTCPAIMGKSKALHEAFRGQPDFLLLAMTIDPERDHPETLKYYGEAWGADFARWKFLTGPVTEVEETLKAYRFPYARQLGQDQIDHTNLLLLVDRQGRRAYDFNILRTSDDVLQRSVRTLLAESGS
jgi:protein SCO1/2